MSNTDELAASLAGALFAEYAVVAAAAADESLHCTTKSAWRATMGTRVGCVPVGGGSAPARSATVTDVPLGVMKKAFRAVIVAAVQCFRGKGLQSEEDHGKPSYVPP